MEGDEQQLIGTPAGRIDALEPVLARVSRGWTVADRACERHPDVPRARGFQQLRGAPSFEKSVRVKSTTRNLLA